MPKKYYPGGFRLTKKTAAALAVRELGTARGLEREPGMPEGYFHILFGNLEARIFPDASDSSHRSSSRLIQMSIDLNGGRPGSSSSSTLTRWNCARRKKIFTAGQRGGKPWKTGSSGRVWRSAAGRLKKRRGFWACRAGE